MLHRRARARPAQVLLSPPVPPPIYFLVALAMMAFLHHAAPIGQLLRAPYRYAGLVLAALAVALILWAALHFKRAGTNIRPHLPSTALVASGPYRFTRNPMYLGMTGILLGAAVYMGSLTPFIVLPAFIAIITERFILMEEAKLEAAFGAAYLEYKARVRRWL